MDAQESQRIERVGVTEVDEILGQKFPVLDDGFIRVVDYMGGDAAIVQAARVSYGAGTKQVHEDIGLIRFLMRHRHCYHPAMQVLTASGWKQWAACDSSEVFLVPDPETCLLKQERCSLEVFDTEEEMVCFKNERMSFCVTPDHRMWFKGKYEDEYKIVRANEMKKWGHFDGLSGYKMAPDLEVGPADHKAAFIGFYLGDGSYGSPGTITFHLRKRRKKEWLETLLRLLKLEAKQRKSSTYEDAIVYTVKTPEFLRQAVDVTARVADKAIGADYLSEAMARPDVVAGLHEGLAFSDGHEPKDRPQQIQFSTVSSTLARQFELLSALRGLDAHRVMPQDGGIRVTAYLPGGRTSLEARRSYFSTRQYAGKVFCATTSTGLLMVRGGMTEFAFVCGNTTPFEMCEIKLHVRVPMDCWRQWIRHRTACLTADTLLQFDLPGGIERRGNQLYKLTVGEVYERFQETENKTRSDKQRNPNFKRDRVQKMNLRCVNEHTQAVEHTKIVDIWESGEKQVWRVETESGAWLMCSADHLFLTEKGWMKLRDFAPLQTCELSPFALYPRLVVVGPGRDTGVVPQFNPIDEATENWRPVLAWEEYYEVSDQGRVRRVIGGKGSRSFGRCKKLTVSNGRAVTSLNRPGMQRVRLVHQLVLEAFVGLEPDGCEACHNDGNGLNNRLSNLRWDSPQSNADDRVRDGATTGLRASCEKIVDVESLGVQMTYDLEVVGPSHNFSANGVIVHNSVNEYSTRYSEAIDACQRTPDHAWRIQSGGNKQGSEGYVSEWPADVTVVPGTPSGYLTRRETELQEMSRGIYEERLKFGVAREQARKDLPLSNYTEAYWKIDLHNLFHFLSLRMDSHAQLEIRSYANVIGNEIVSKWVPAAWEAFKDYRLWASFFSFRDKQVLYYMNIGSSDAAIGVASDYGWLEKRKDGSLKGNRERQECEDKLGDLGLVAPWNDTSHG